MADESFVVIYEAETELDVAICKSILDEAGIPVIVRPVGEVWARISFGASYRPAAHLLVPPDQAEQAKHLLADYQAQVDSGAFSLPDDVDE